MATKEVKQWITINGKHIPIFEGESKADVVKRATKKNTKTISENETKKASKKTKVQEQIEKDNDLKEKQIAENKAQTTNNNDSKYGTNNVKVVGKEETWEGIKRVHGSYEILFNDGENTVRKKELGYITEHNGRTFGFTPTPNEDGFTITDLKTGMIIDRTHPKTDYIGIGKSRTLTGKSGYAVKDSLLLFSDRISNKAMKDRLTQMEEVFNKTKKKK